MNEPAPREPARHLHATPEPDLAGRVRSARDAARTHLLSLQRSDGHWCAELEGDCILESEYVLTQWFLGRGESERCRKAATYLRRKQAPEGGWPIYEGGPPDVSSTAKAYLVLKLMGDAPEADHMTRARETVLRLGGLEACNTFTQIYLAIFGQFPWARCPAVPPEMLLLPRWSPFNIYGISSWSRTIVVPLSIIWAHKPVVKLPERGQIPELMKGEWPRNAGVRKFTQSRVWTTFFAGVDKTLKLWERFPKKPLRARALKRCEEWTLERLRRSDGLGAIFPPIVNTIFALRCLGYGLADPSLASQIEQLDRLVIEEDDHARVQPCFSPVWDTGIALNALLESGLGTEDPAALNAARWLIDHEVKELGDWAHRVPDVAPGGWYFEYANEFYPDCDDTAEVLMALARCRFRDPRDEKRKQGAVDRGLAWLLAMQNKDGGWAAFDKDCDNEVFTHVPFADHNAMLDPSCEDVTARVLESLHVLGFTRDDPAIMKAIGWLLERQEEDGSWFGRWGCNYIYGTWLVLWGLRAIGFDPQDARVQKARGWIESVQNADGGWGETPESYDEPSAKGKGESTAAQTAWALLALHASDAKESDAARRGVAYLLDKQREDGSWHDVPWTGTGFPRVFYLRYHYYCIYFPLLALGAYCDEEGTTTQ